MLNLVRLGNKTVSKDYASVEVLKNAIKLNSIALQMLGAVPGETRIDVAVDGKGSGAEIYIAAIQNKDGKAGRQLSKNSTLNSSSIKAALNQFRCDVFEITDESTEFEGETWYKLTPKKGEEVVARGKGTKVSAIESAEV